MNKKTFPCVHSNPIWYKIDENSSNQYVCFRQTFIPERKEARLIISCDSRAVVYLNQQLVGLVLYDGTETTSWYEEFALINCKIKEENELKIIVYYQGLSSSNYTAVRPQLIFGVEADMEQRNWIAYSGEQTICQVCSNYQSGPVERNQMGYVWHYDATALMGNWSQAKCWKGEDREYRKRPILRQELKERHKMQVCERGYLPESDLEEFGTVPLTPIPLDEIIAVNRPYYLILDCQEECTGLLELELTGTAGSKIYIGWGEHLADKRVRSHIGERCFESSYICLEGKQTFTHYFHRLGLRYLELHIYPAADGHVDCSYAGILPLEYPVKEIGYMELQEPLHQKIYDIAVKTLKLCMHEHYEDCPWREQGLYAMDALNQALCGYYCFEEYTFAAASLELLGEGLQKDGFLELHTPGKDAVAIPYFTFMWVMGVRDYLVHSKDTEFVKKLWPKIETIVKKRLEECQQDLLLTMRSPAYWNFYDWTDLLSGEPIYREKDLEERVDAPYQMSFLMMLDAVRTMSRILGYTDYEEKLDEIICKMQIASRKLFWDEESGSFLTYAYKKHGRFCPEQEEYGELVQAWAVLSGVASEEQKEVLLPKLAKAQQTWVPCTLGMIRYKYEALLQQPERYGAEVFNSIAEIWGNMIKQGATSFWETEDGAAAFDGAGSLCHGWSAMPVYFYHVYAKGTILTPRGALYGKSTVK